MKRNVILIVIGIIIFNSCDGADLRRIFRTKRAESDFILRSCIATAQLTRKHRTNDASQLVVEDISLPKLAPASLALDNLKSNYVNKRLRNDLRFRPRPKGRNFVEKSTTDTPLGTVDVKAVRKDIPKVFKKREPLPELDRKGAARNLDADTPIIVVQSLKH